MDPCLLPAALLPIALLPMVLLAELLKEKEPSQQGLTLMDSGPSPFPGPTPPPFLHQWSRGNNNNLNPLGIRPRHHTQCLPRLCSWSQVVGRGGHYNCSHCPPKGTLVVKERGRDAAWGHPSERGDCGWVTAAWAESQLCLIRRPAGWNFTANFGSHWSIPGRDSHRTGMKRPA